MDERVGRRASGRRGHEPEDADEDGGAMMMQNRKRNWKTGRYDASGEEGEEEEKEKKEETRTKDTQRSSLSCKPKRERALHPNALNWAIVPKYSIASAFRPSSGGEFQYSLFLSGASPGEPRAGGALPGVWGAEF
jgi:hypothetical protein